MQTKTEMLMKQYPDHVVILLEGMFYNAHGVNAYILSYLTGYKLRKNGSNVRCGFPATSLQRVQKLFEKARINYIIYSGELLEAHRVYADNEYQQFISYLKISCKNEGKSLTHSQTPTESKKVDAKMGASLFANQIREDPLIEFLTNLENGRHPYYGSCCTTLDLNDTEMQRYFHEIKMQLSAPQKERWDW